MSRGFYMRFLYVSLMILCVLALPACAPATALATVQPTATLAPTLAPTITPDAAQPLVMVLPGSSEQKMMIAVNRHYSDVIKRQGCNVDFYTVQQKYEDGSDSYLQYIAKQLVSGAARADGYFGWFGYNRGQAVNQPLDTAKEQGLLYDCAAAAPQVVPQYWSKFQDQIVQSPYGLPLCLNYKIDSHDGYALALRKDVQSLAMREPKDFPDMRALLDILEKAKVENGYLMTQYNQWVDVWTLQQGYMAIFRYAGIYAKVDDPDAKPIFLENIPGYGSFIKDTVALMESGQLRFSSGVESESKAPAMVLDSAGMFTSPYVTQNYTDYAVYPFFPSLPYSSNLFFAELAIRRADYNMEMMIPSRNRRAADAMAFVQWVYASQDNAECVMYGQQGEDFALRGDRISFSTELAQRLRYRDERYWPGQDVFGGATQARIPLDAPENTEGLLAAWSQQRFAAPWLGYLADIDLNNDDSRQAMLSAFDHSMQNESLDKNFNVDDWISALRQATPKDYMEPYVEALHQAQSQQQ